ncbi:Six-hairpin glycosidase-like protein, partial [Dichotomocladium elegans]
ATDMPNKSIIDEWLQEETSISFENIKRNINPPGAIRGFVAASPSRDHPNYFYSWTRDAGLVMRVVASTRYNDETKRLLQDYVAQEIYHQAAPTVCNCLGEPKFNPDGSGYDGAWGRPQNDGPAIRATTFILLASRFTPDYVERTLKPAIFRDLDYISDVWSEPCFDLWEEVCGVHFYTLMVMRRALTDGAAFALAQGDFSRQALYVTTADKIAERLASFWNGAYYAATQDLCEPGSSFKPSGLDMATILAVIHTGWPKKVLATAHKIEAVFEQLYPLNAERPSGVGISIGRYPEDTYDGYQSGSLGNPWFITTAAMAELYYRAIHEWKSEQTTVAVNSINAPFFAKLMGMSEDALIDRTFPFGSKSFTTLVQRMADEADRFMATVRYHQRDNGSLSEQFNRFNGFEQGARDLSWSYAAMISSADARAGHLI